MIPLRPSHVVFYAAVVTFTVTLAMACGFGFIRSQMLAGNDFLLDAESKEILARLEPLKPDTTPDKIEAALREHAELDEALFFFQVSSPGGAGIFHSANLRDGRLPDLPGVSGKLALEVAGLGLVRVAQYETRAFRVQIAMSLRNFESVNAAFLRVFLLGIPLVALLTFGFGTALRRSTLRPVRQMQSAARRITASNLSERIVVPPGGGEMAALAQLFNEMIDRLEKSFNQIKRFTADTSHELMTPLSIIRLHGERLLHDSEMPPKFHHALEEQLQESLYLTDTLERLLTLAKADSSVLPLKLEDSDTADYIARFAEDAQMLAESRGFRLETARNEPGIAAFDQGWIRHVLFNLLSNALRHSPPGGVIACHSRCQDGWWSVEVWDEGPGVPADRLSHIFERFVQIAPSPDPGSGAGLGLAICKSIIELHKGRIHARLRQDRSGLVVGFELPCRPEREGAGGRTA